MRRFVFGSGNQEQLRLFPPALKKAELGHQECKSSSHPGPGPRAFSCRSASEAILPLPMPIAPVVELCQPSAVLRQIPRGWVTPSSLRPDTGHAGRLLQCRFYVTCFYCSYFFFFFLPVLIFLNARLGWTPSSPY